MGAIIGGERGNRRGIGRQAARGEGPSDQHRDTISHHRRCLLVVERGQAARRHQPVQRRGEVRHRVDQRAIEVQQQGSGQGRGHFEALRNLI